MAQQTIDTTPVTDVFTVNDKPYRRGNVWFEWNDRNETLTIRPTKWDASTPIMAETEYSQILLGAQQLAPSTYQELIDYITTNCA